MNIRRRMVFALIPMSLLWASAGHAASAGSWDGTWSGAWGGRESEATSVTVAGKRVVSYTYQGVSHPVTSSKVTAAKITYEDQGVTVTLTRTPGAGGRNQQFALACALDLANHPGERLAVLSAGSDGIDGNTRSAGAIADPTTVARARAFGFNPEQSLAEFNACPLFTSIGDSVATGPTGHNLRDLRLLISESS